MTQKSVNSGYWQTSPLARSQIVLIETSIADRIPNSHPVRLLDEILDRLDWTAWENTRPGAHSGQFAGERLACAGRCHES
jgi:transposase